MKTSPEHRQFSARPGLFSVASALILSLTCFSGVRIEIKCPKIEITTKTKSEIKVKRKKQQQQQQKQKPKLFNFERTSTNIIRITKTDVLSHIMPGLRVFQNHARSKKGRQFVVVFNKGTADNQ